MTACSHGHDSVFKAKAKAHKMSHNEDLILYHSHSFTKHLGIFTPWSKVWEPQGVKAHVCPAMYHRKQDQVGKGAAPRSQSVVTWPGPEARHSVHASIEFPVHFAERCHLGDPLESECQGERAQHLLGTSPQPGPAQHHPEQGHRALGPSMEQLQRTTCKGRAPR